MRGLRSRIKNKKIKRVWLDWPRLIKGVSVDEFKKGLTGRSIVEVSRRGKFIIFHLSGRKTVLAHQKMTGHFLVGRWRRDKKRRDKRRTAGTWIAAIAGPLQDDPMNDFIRLLITFTDNSQLALSDVRRFARLQFINKTLPFHIDKKVGVPDLDRLGPEPFSSKLTTRYLQAKLAKRIIPIKQLLLDQTIVAGVGNIYADEALWLAKIHPRKPAQALSAKELEKIIKAVRKVLKEAIVLCGTSRGDYRQPDGSTGGYQRKKRVYGREGQKCQRCGTIVKREKIAQRSAHYCPRCQNM